MSTSWRWQLRLFRGDDAPCDLVVDGGATITVGRGAVNDVALDDATASSHHAALRVADECVEVCDRGSRFGTFVGSAPTGAAWTPVPPGEVIWVGETAIEVVAAAPAERGAPGGAGVSDDGHAGDEATVMLDAPPTSRRGVGDATAASASAAPTSGATESGGAAACIASGSTAEDAPLARDPAPIPALLRVDDGARAASFFVAGGASDTLDARALATFAALRDAAPIVVAREHGAVVGLYDARGASARFTDGVLLLGGATFSLADRDDSLASVVAPRLGFLADGTAPRAADGGSVEPQPGAGVSQQVPGATAADADPSRSPPLTAHASGPAEASEPGAAPAVTPRSASPTRAARASGNADAGSDTSATRRRRSRGRAAAVAIAVGLGGAAFAAWTLVSVVFTG